MENVKIRLLRMGIVIMAFAVTASLVNRPHIGAAGNSGRIALN